MNIMTTATVARLYLLIVSLMHSHSICLDSYSVIVMIDYKSQG